MVGFKFIQLQISKTKRSTQSITFGRRGAAAASPPPTNRRISLETCTHPLLAPVSDQQLICIHLLFLFVYNWKKFRDGNRTQRKKWGIKKFLVGFLEWSGKKS